MFVQKAAVLFVFILG